MFSKFLFFLTLMSSLCTFITCNQSYAVDVVVFNSAHWQKSDDGVLRDYDSAVSYCRGLNIGGYSGWRLPTKSELKGLVFCSNGHPVPLKDGEACSWGGYGSYSEPTIYKEFKAKPSHYWASTKSGRNEAWYVLFDIGGSYTQPKNIKCYVRCVR